MNGMITIISLIRIATWMSIRIKSVVLLRWEFKIKTLNLIKFIVSKRLDFGMKVKVN